MADEPQTDGTLRVLATADLDHFDATSAGLVTTNNFLRAVARQLINYEASADEATRISPKGGLLQPRCPSQPMTA